MDQNVSVLRNHGSLGSRLEEIGFRLLPLAAAARYAPAGRAWLAATGRGAHAVSAGPQLCLVWPRARAAGTEPLRARGPAGPLTSLLPRERVLRGAGGGDPAEIAR